MPVPVGTMVRGPDGSVLADLATAGDRWLAAGGGRGGRGNARFLSNRRRAPAFAEQGEKGEERWLDLELKLLADVALVGLPNSGKSTLISRISAARPKIADYPFTTLEPHLGVVRVGRPGDETEFVVADVPGLVEGAADGRGLGHRFLRHVERARALVVLLDLAAADGLSPAEQERILLHELGRYRPELLERPRLVVGSKSDVAVAGARRRARADHLGGDRSRDPRAARPARRHGDRGSGGRGHAEPVGRDPPAAVGGDRGDPLRRRLVRGARPSRPASRGPVGSQRPRRRRLRPEPPAPPRGGACPGARRGARR